MTYWGAYSRWNKPIIEAYQKHMRTPFVLIDGGAAGDVSEPFDLARDISSVVRFEPRGEDAVELSESDIFVDGGLWSEDGDQVLHVAKAPATSSICAPNYELLCLYDDKYGVPIRKTVAKQAVPVRSIDSCVSKQEIPLPNFIKLDIHSAELPALRGAANSLSQCVGLLVETWNVEVHKGQGLHYEVEKFAYEHGFEVFDSICASRWKSKHNGEVGQFDRGRYIGTEILLVNKDTSAELAINKSLVLALFGFYNESKNALSGLNDATSLNLYKSIEQVQKSLSRAPKLIVKDLLKRLLVAVS